MVDQRESVYQRITNQIVASIEAGVSAFRMPWHHDGSATARPINVVTGKRYRGANTLALWAAAESAGYTSGLWATYRQWTAKGAYVRQGEQATTIVFWKFPTSRDDHAESNDGETVHDRRGGGFARGYSVFNRCQVENFKEEPAASLDDRERIQRADDFYESLGIATTLGADSAFYRIEDDRIFMPAFSRFVDPISFYSVLYHEAGHATGAPHRLDRNLAKRFTTHATAIEEIIAELSAAFILADLGLAFEPRDDHAAYVGSWARALKHDMRAIFAAASQAQAAAEWMHQQQGHDRSRAVRKVA